MERGKFEKYGAVVIKDWPYFSSGRFRDWTWSDMEVLYIAGISGGGAFFFIFILFTLFLGFPFLIAEFMVGR